MDRSKPVKYGLEIRRKPQSHRPATAAKPLPPVRDAKLQTLFGNDDDDDVEADIARQNLKKRSQRETEQQHEAAMAEDPSVFDYDGVYDTIHAARTSRAKEAVQRQARYIPNLLKTTKEREKEKELVQERLLAKERAKEEEEFAGKERFVTRAYREKLVERQRWLAEEKRKEAEEAANDHNFDFCFNPSSRPAAPFLTSPPPPPPLSLPPQPPFLQRLLFISALPPFPPCHSPLPPLFPITPFPPFLSSPSPLFPLSPSSPLPRPSVPSPSCPHVSSSASRGDGLPLRSSQEGAGEDETRQAGGVGREGGSAGGGNGGAGVSGEHSLPGVRKPLEGGDSKSVKVSAEDKVSDARARFLARKKQKSVP
ncbi:unnamed protein product [Closterium sp. Naga37s-1]|nr:unnamed protein product [Closterium sp. Naga37s-1]